MMCGWECRALIRGNKNKTCENENSKENVWCDQAEQNQKRIYEEVYE